MPRMEIAVVVAVGIVASAQAWPTSKGHLVSMAAAVAQEGHTKRIACTLERPVVVVERRILAAAWA